MKKALYIVKTWISEAAVIMRLDPKDITMAKNTISGRCSPFVYFMSTIVPFPCLVRKADLLSP